MAVPPPLSHVVVVVGVKLENRTFMLKTLAVASTFSLLPRRKNHPDAELPLELVTSAREDSVSAEPFVMSVVSLIP